jgi:hypothetical protein
MKPICHRPRSRLYILHNTYYSYYSSRDRIPCVSRSDAEAWITSINLDSGAGPYGCNLLSTGSRLLIQLGSASIQGMIEVREPCGEAHRRSFLARASPLGPARDAQPLRRNRPQTFRRSSGFDKGVARLGAASTERSLVRLSVVCSTLESSRAPDEGRVLQPELSVTQERGQKPLSQAPKHIVKDVPNRNSR